MLNLFVELRWLMMMFETSKHGLKTEKRWCVFKDNCYICVNKTVLYWTLWLNYRRFRWVVVCTFEVCVLLSLWINSHNCLALPAFPKTAASLFSDNVKSSWILSTFLMTDLEKKSEDSVTEQKNVPLTFVTCRTFQLSFFIVELQIYNFLLFISAQDAFDIGDPSSMQDVRHICTKANVLIHH